jgi:hypothetical protein
MAKSRIINIVATECPCALEPGFNKWYNEIHVPMLMKYKGIKKVTRYKVADGNKDKGSYLAVYEYDSKEDLDRLNSSPEFKAAIEEMNTTWKNNEWQIKWGMSCEPLQAWGK